MVRPEDSASEGTLQERAEACCIEPAGESPARVIAGEPDSRPQAGGESPLARAGRQKPAVRRKQENGPQHQVKPAASSDLQRESRAGHFAAKAMASALEPERVEDLPGVWGAARSQGSVRNRRDPSAQPESGQGGSYKPKAKSSRAQRESEGAVVPMMSVANKALGGKGPCGADAGGEGTGKGMPRRTTSANHPGGRKSVADVRRPQHRLGVGAKRASGRRSQVLLCPPAVTFWWRLVVGGLRCSCTMPRSDTAPVSRVREIRMHGLNGGPDDGFVAALAEFQ
jgi:hypothetical protein